MKDFILDVIMSECVKYDVNIVHDCLKVELSESRVMSHKKNHGRGHNVSCLLIIGTN